MTPRQSDKAVAMTLSDKDVAEYLRSHPDFFDQHQNVLLDLELHHRPGRTAVSLVQRQVAMLRRRNKELHAQLSDLVAVARENQELVEKIHQLAVLLMAEVDAERRVQVLGIRLREDFKVERAVLIMFTAPYAIPAHDRFVKVVDRRDGGLKPFRSFLKSNVPRCIRLKAGHRRFAFGDAHADLQSAALIPLGSRAQLGFIVIGSRDPDHFNPAQGTDYLRRLGEVASSALMADSAAASARSSPQASGS